MFIDMDIKLYDFLCSNSPLYVSLMKAIEELNIYPSFEKITDVDTIFAISKKPPLLFVNGELKLEGQYPDVAELKELLKKEIEKYHK